MDPSVEFLDKFPPIKKGNHRSGFSRADLVALALLVAIVVMLGA